MDAAMWILVFTHWGTIGAYTKPMPIEDCQALAAISRKQPAACVNQKLPGVVVQPTPEFEFGSRDEKVDHLEWIIKMQSAQIQDDSETIQRLQKDQK